MIKYGRALKTLDYPDEKFIKLNQEMLKALDGFEVAIKTKNSAQIKSAWQIVEKTCTECHNVYE